MKPCWVCGFVNARGRHTKAASKMPRLVVLRHVLREVCASSLVRTPTAFPSWLHALRSIRYQTDMASDDKLLMLRSKDRQRRISRAHRLGNRGLTTRPARTYARKQAIDQRGWRSIATSHGSVEWLCSICAWTVLARS